MLSKGVYKLCRLIFTTSYWTCTLPLFWDDQKQYPALSLNKWQRRLCKLTSTGCILGSTFTLCIMAYNILTRVTEPSVAIYGIFLCSGIGTCTSGFVFMWFHFDEIIFGQWAGAFYVCGDWVRSSFKIDFQKIRKAI